VTTDKTAAKPSNDPLVGRWFHSIIIEGDGCRIAQWQGQVVDRVHPNMYLLQRYEWSLGEASTTTLVPAGDMAGWVFYDTHEHMNDEYERTLQARTQAHLDHGKADRS
jgi:hypothetical protein